MKLRHLVTTAGLATVVACSGNIPDVSSDSQWVGTITTEGNVTTVVNESGSVWGGEIGLVDRQLAVVRVFDMSGTHLFDIGREGDDPGEFRRPWTIGTGPDDRLIVQDQRRVNIFTLDGDLIETWPYRDRVIEPFE